MKNINPLHNLTCGSGWARGYTGRGRVKRNTQYYRALFTVQSLLYFLIGREMLWLAETRNGDTHAYRLVMPRDVGPQRAGYIGHWTRMHNELKKGERWTAHEAL